MNYEGSERGRLVDIDKMREEAKRAQSSRPGVEVQFDHLERMLQRCAEALDALEQRITPCLRDPVDAAIVGGDLPDGGTSPLARRLYAFGDLARQHGDRLVALVDAVDL